MAERTSGERGKATKEVQARGGSEERSRPASEPNDEKAADQYRRLLSESDAVVGRLLGDARERAGIPQSYAARQIGWPQSRLANVELGRRRLLFLEALLLADLYSVPLSAFDPRVTSPAPRAGRRRRTHFG